MIVWDQKSLKNPNFSTMYINLYVPKRGSILGSFVEMNHRLDLRDIKSILHRFSKKEAQFGLILTYIYT